MKNPDYASPKLVAEAIRAAERAQHGNHKLPSEYQESSAVRIKRMSMLRYVERLGQAK